MEGIVAKLGAGSYSPEATTWVKIKNRAYSQAVGRHDFFESPEGGGRVNLSWLRQLWACSPRTRRAAKERSQAMLPHVVFSEVGFAGRPCCSMRIQDELSEAPVWVFPPKRTE